MLEFEKVYYKNFMSVGNHGLSIQLDRSPTTLVGGKNGSGKSTLLEAIAYGLFGQTLKKIVLGGLINTTNKKGAEVTIWFKKNGKSYRIVRGQKPNKLEFWINDELQPQDGAVKDTQAKIEYVLGMDFKLFTQVTILNKERYVPFMEMKAADRRKVVEDILDISVFSGMAKLLKSDMDTIQLSIQDLKYERTKIENKITAQQRLIDEAQSNVDDRRKEVQDEIDQLTKTLDGIEKEILSLQDSIADVGDPQSTMNKAKTRKSEFDKIATTFQGKIKVLSDKLSFYKDNDHCPTCKQEIDSEFKKTEIETAQEQSNKIRANALLLVPEIEKVIALNKDLEAEVEKLRNLNNDLRVAQTDKRNTESSIDKKEKMLVLLVANPKLDEYREEKQDLENLLIITENKLTKEIQQEELLKLARDYLKDEGIKSSIVKDYIGFMNIRINEYLNAMNYFLSITLDENFDEKINAINKDTFTIDNLSTGQKCRVNLSVWMALLEVSSLKNSAVTNLICLDEVLENLDANGVEDFMKLVKDKLPHKNLFVITQRFEEFKDHFRSSIEFQLNQDQFTEII